MKGVGGYFRFHSLGTTVGVLLSDLHSKTPAWTDKGHARLDPVPSRQPAASSLQPCSKGPEKIAKITETNREGVAGSRWQGDASHIDGCAGIYARKVVHPFFA